MRALDHLDIPQLMRVRMWTKRPAKLDPGRGGQVQRLIQHAHATCPFYREYFESNAVDVRRIRSEEDLLSIPPIDKEVLRGVESLKRSSAGAELLGLYEHTSSGSSGRPMHFWVDRTAHYIRWALIERVLRAHGCRPWHRIARIVHSDRNRLWYHNIGWPLFSMVDFPVTASVEEASDFVLRSRPHFVISYPSYLASVADALRREERQQGSLKTVISGGETCLRSLRTRIEGGFGVPLADMYGAAEAGTIAWQCSYRDSYHINEDAVLCSVLRADGSERRTGTGRLVLTNLYFFASPVIRYCIDDIVRITDRDCACGWKGPVIEQVVGRLNQYVVLGDGRMVPPDTVDAVLCGSLEGVKEYQLEQASHDDFILHIVPRQDDYSRERVLGRLAALTELLGADNRYRLEEHEVRVPRSGRGKLSAVVSRLPQNDPAKGG